MSFWDNVKKFAQPYTDEDYDDYEDEVEGFEEEPAEEPAPRERRRTAEAPRAEVETEPKAESRFTGKVLNMNNSQSVVLFRPNEFKDASKAADELKDKKVVILNLENVDKTMARRVVDFLSGCSYALDGKVRKIAQATYLFAPKNMDVVGELDNIVPESESAI